MAKALDFCSGNGYSVYRANNYPASHGTTRPRDCKTARPRDCETTRHPEKHRHSQAFPGIPSRAWQFVVRRASDTTLGEFRVDGLYLDVLPIGEIIRQAAVDDPLSQQRTNLLSEGRQMWCEMIVPWMGHTKTYFPFAASEFRAADDPLSQQITERNSSFAQIYSDSLHPLLA